MSDTHEEEAREPGGGGLDLDTAGNRRTRTVGDHTGRRWRFDDAVHAARHLSTRTS